MLGREITGQADVYALGLMLLQSLTGERPFPGTAVESATARLTRGPVIDQHLPTAWRTLLHVMTAQDPAERPTAAEAARRLRALERDGSAPATQLLPGAPEPSPPLRRVRRRSAVPHSAPVARAAASADEATRAMPTAAAAGGPDDATRAYDRTTPTPRPTGQDDVATTVLGTQRGAAAGGAAGAAAGGAARARAQRQRVARVDPAGPRQPPTTGRSGAAGRSSPRSSSCSSCSPGSASRWPP